MREVTIVLAYYENPTMLQRQYAHLRALPPRFQERLRLIVVDDGSPDNPATPPDPPLWWFGGFELHRMMVDVPWNQDACRNLAMTRVRGWPAAWALLTDMDHLPSERALTVALDSQLDPARVYRFSRVSEPDLTPYHPHPNSWLLTRDLYDRAGGYDERWAGVYGTDGGFSKQLIAVAGPPVLLDAPLIRVPREVTPDASTTRYERRSKANDAARQAVHRQLAGLSKSQRAAPLRGRFPSVRLV
jgi:hypothetical protein